MASVDYPHPTGGKKKWSMAGIDYPHPTGGKEVVNGLY